MQDNRQNENFDHSEEETKVFLENGEERNENQNDSAPSEDADQSPKARDEEETAVFTGSQTDGEKGNRACQEGEPSSAEEKDPFAEGQTNTDGDSREKESTSVNRAPTYSSVSYVPPYYVPNFTVATGAGDTEEQKKTRSKGGSRAWVVVVAAVLSVVISFGVGGVAGYFGAIFASGFFGNTGLDDGTATITKNNGSIIIDEVLESDADMYTEVYSVAAIVADSVVEITTSKTQYQGQYVTSGAGSGVIIAQTDTVGVIVTNFHVVEGANNIVIRLTSGKEYAASYRGGDVSLDIAVLYISLADGEKLNCATFGDSEKLVVGQRVIAIGNPLGSLGGTVTDGIISALDRKITIEDNVMTLLQTNTAINPGNSGGGLFDMAGRLVGIVNAKQSAEGIEGLGFAIPINIIEDAIASITEHGYVQGRPSLGIDVSYAGEVFTEGGIAYAKGLYVVRVNDDTTGFQLYDRIVSINGRQLDSKIEYNTVLSTLEVGSTVEIKFERKSFWHTQTYTVQLKVKENTLNY